MKSAEFVKRIRNYSIASFLIPLIAINSCLLMYKFMGNLDINYYPNINWNKQEHSYTLNEFKLANSTVEFHTFTNCPKYHNTLFFHYIDNGELKTIRNDPKSFELIEKIKENNKIESVTFKAGKNLNTKCVKNHQFLYSLLKKFSWLETILIKTVRNNPTGFVKIKNPYLYGETSISRTARYFPATFIFKPLIILSAFFLFLYWKNNLNLYRELKNKNILGNFTEKFFYFGLFSCIFLTFHALFLGLDIESKLFSQIRRLIIILFIVFEVIAQILLTKNLFTFKNELKEYISPLILKIKVLFVVIVFITTLVAFSILTFANPTTGFKHILEWNYFSFLLLYYLLSRLLWVGQKNQKF